MLSARPNIPLSCERRELRFPVRRSADLKVCSSRDALRERHSIDRTPHPHCLRVRQPRSPPLKAPIHRLQPCEACIGTLKVLPAAVLTRFDASSSQEPASRAYPSRLEQQPAERPAVEHRWMHVALPHRGPFTAFKPRLHHSTRRAAFAISREGCAAGSLRTPRG